jgi:DNA-binding MarR family transcriptional regulator
MSYELERSIGFKINQTANKINNKYTQILQSYNIAPEQRAVLEIIKYESDVTQTKIATILGKDKTTICRTLNALENKSFIKKSQKDKRTNLIEITPEGEDILEKCSLCVKNFRQSLSSKLKDEELEELILLLEKVALSVGEDL